MMKNFVVFMMFFLVVASISVILALKSEAPDRKATLYNYDGKIIRDYSGKIEYVRRNSGGVRFWLDGKRIIIQGGIVIVEDK